MKEQENGNNELNSRLKQVIERSNARKKMLKEMLDQLNKQKTVGDNANKPDKSQFDEIK